MAVGHVHTCAVGLEAKVYCWGKNDFGQCDMGAQVFGLEVGGLSAGLLDTCAVGTRGELACWGWDAGGDRPQRL